jgi:hypothetical protein
LIGETPCDWDFSHAQHPLQPATSLEITGAVIPDTWQQLYLFGETNHAEGGGALPYFGIHIVTGEVCGFDVERDGPPVNILNSSALRFIDSFSLFDRVFGHKTETASGLAARVRAIDPDVFERSEW